MDKIRKQPNIGLIDFVLNYKGSIEEYLFPFMIEQGYNSFQDYYDADTIIKTDHNINEITNIPINKNDVIASKTDTSIDITASYNYSFDYSFDS